MKKILVLALLFLTSCYSTQDIWCFVGTYREFRCHVSYDECLKDWHLVWDYDISHNIQHPLQCEKL